MDVAINGWAVIVAAIASIAVGSVWYGPLFQKPWMKLAGITKEAMKSMGLSPLQAMAGGAVGSLLTAWVLSWLYTALQLEGASGALNLAFWAWLGFTVPLSAGDWLWQGKSFKLFLLNTAYYLVSFAVMSLIVGLWR